MLVLCLQAQVRRTARRRGPGGRRGTPVDNVGQGHEDGPCGRRGRAGRNLSSPAPNYPEEGAKEQRGSALPKVTQPGSGKSRTRGLGVQRCLARSLARLGWMGNSTGSHTWPPRKGASGARGRSLSEVPVTAAGTLSAALWGDLRRVWPKDQVPRPSTLSTFAP